MRNTIFENTVFGGYSRERFESSKIKEKRNILNVSLVLVAIVSLICYFTFKEKIEFVGSVSQFLFMASGVILIVSYPMIEKDLKNLKKERFQETFKKTDMNNLNVVSALSKTLEVVFENIKTGKIKSSMSVDEITQKMDDLKQGKIDFNYENFGFVIDLVEKLETK